MYQNQKQQGIKSITASVLKSRAQHNIVVLQSRFNRQFSVI